MTIRAQHHTNIKNLEKRFKQVISITGPVHKSFITRAYCVPCKAALYSTFIFLKNVWHLVAKNMPPSAKTNFTKGTKGEWELERASA